jgi:hypothetical protein
MRPRRPTRRRDVRRLGIALLILSLVHTPLPQLDFHNIRHHDGPGEVCEHHDHLLRWHPGAGRAADVAILHWHWLLPDSAPIDVTPSGGGPALHAHVPDWQGATWDEGPVVVPDARSRPLDRPAAGPLAAMSLDLPAGLATPGRDPDERPPLAFGATFAPRATLTSLLHRWVC